MADEFELPPIAQIGIVVRDLKRAMDAYSESLGIGPWNVHTASAPPLNCTYKGEPAHYRVMLAFAQFGSLSIELIQYQEGDTIHRDFSRDRGEGVEHLGVHVLDLDVALADMRERGIGVLQQADGMGVRRDGRYAYLDTESSLGTVLELIQPASEDSPPEYVHP